MTHRFSQDGIFAYGILSLHSSATPARAGSKRRNETFANHFPFHETLVINALMPKECITAQFHASPQDLFWPEPQGLRQSFPFAQRSLIAISLS
jgi:hypothetical protein